MPEPCRIRLGDTWHPACVVARRQRPGYIELRVRYAIEHAGRRDEVEALLDAASPDLRLDAEPPRPAAPELDPEAQARRAALLRAITETRPGVPVILRGPDGRRAVANREGDRP